MHTTLELLDTALRGGDSERELSRMLKLGSSTLGVARHRGRLSPKAAGTLAAHIGLDPTPWMALAALEAEKPDGQLQILRARIAAQIDKARNSWLSTLHAALRMTSRPRRRTHVARPQYA